MIEVFAAGEASPITPFECPTYRIPALAVLPAGRVVLACDVRADWRDLPGDFDVVCKLSDDAGATWSEQIVIRGHDERGYGDASLLFDPVTGVLWCFYVSAGGQGFFTGDLRLEASISTDGGETWAARGPVAVEWPGETGFASSGNGLALASGRLVQPLVLRRPSGIFAAMLLSDDHGETWRVGELVGPDCDENKVIEVPKGLLLQARARPRRRQAWSMDGGETWAAGVPHPALVDPSCNGGLTAVGETLVASGLNHESDRRDLSVRVSVDWGESWSAPTLVRAGASAYSVAQPMGDKVALAWEDGDYSAIWFASLTLDQCRGDLIPRRGGPLAAKGIAANPDR